MAKGVTPSVNIDKCKGCLTCVLICSLTKEGSCNPSLARIHVSAEPKGITFGDCDGCLICTKFCAFGALGRCESWKPSEVMPEKSLLLTSLQEK